MGYISDTGAFNTNQVDEVTPSTKVLDSVFNAFFSKFLSNDARLKDADDRMKLVVYVNLDSTQWQGASAPYTQTVTTDKDGVALTFTANDRPVLCKYTASGQTEAQAKDYNKAFGIVGSGSGTTGAGSVTFSVWKLPTTSLIVGLRGV